MWLGQCGIAAASLGIFLTLAPATYGQTSTSKPLPEQKPSGWRRFSFGGRINGLPFNVLNNKTVNISPANTSQSWSISTTNNYTKIAYGPSLEFRLTTRFAIGGELLYHRLDYTKTTTVTDTNGNTTITEQTGARLWDIPAMVRFHGLSESGFGSKLYFAGGGELRKVSRIRTSNSTTFPDGSTASNNTPVVPASRNAPGVVVGVGFRVVDDFGFKLSPELRYTRWMGATFASDSTRMRRDELDVGIALTY